MAYTAFLPFPRCGKTVGLSAPCIIVISGFLVLMTIDAPVQVVMASLAVVLVVIEFVSVFLYPARIRVFNPPVFMIEGHAVLFNMFVADIACNLLLASFLVTWNADTEHVGNQVYGNCITLFYVPVALITLNFIFKMYLVGKFQVSIFFRDIVFHLYFHTWSCMAHQTRLRIIGIKILHVAGKTFCHLGPFRLKVVTIKMTGIAVLQTSFHVFCVAVMNFRLFAATQQQEEGKHHKGNRII